MAKLSDYKVENNIESKDELINESLEEKYNKYKDFSQEDINKEIFKEVEKQKQNGTFDYNQIDSIIESLKPSLTTEQYQNMRKIMDEIK